MTAIRKADIITELKSDILRMQGFKPCSGNAVDLGLGPIIHSFPNATFPLGAVHEFLSTAMEDLVATKGFIAGLLGTMMDTFGTVLWVSTSESIFPPALKSFEVEPDRVIFIKVKKEKDSLWVMEEGLKCSAINAVVGELGQLSFTSSRRLQLAVEQSQVTGFVIRKNSRATNMTACVSRWKISSLASECVEDLPGVGFPKWKVELLRVRNGKTGMWELVWKDGRFDAWNDLASGNIDLSSKPSILRVNEKILKVG